MNRLEIWLSMVDPNYLKVALVVAGLLWISIELRNSPRWMRIVAGFALIAAGAALHLVVAGWLRGEIEVRRMALKNIEMHLEGGGSGEVIRAIKIHDREYSNSGNSGEAGYTLLHELNRGTE